MSRAFEVTRILSRYGFAWVFTEIGLRSWIPRRRRVEEPLELPLPIAFRRALEELGPTAVKLGQALSTRADVLPDEWVEQLRELQDHVTALPFEPVRAVIEDEFGRPLEELFAIFEQQPIASASIGQVHFAELHSGVQVAVKVQRPGIRAQIDSDLAILAYMARMAESQFKWCEEHRVASLVADFSRQLRGELDFGLEAQNTKLLGQLLADDPRATVPSVHDQVSSRRVLTAQRVRGHKPTETAELDALGVDRAAMARNLAGLILKQVLRDGTFHADPHGGNVLIDDAGRITFLDCGNVAFCPPHVRDGLVYLLFALLEGDAEEVAAQIAAIGLPTTDTDMTALQADVNRQIVNLHSLSTADMAIGDVLNELLSMISRHHIIMPPIFAQIIRALVLTDAECRALDPRFDFREVARNVVSDTLRFTTRPRRALLEAYRVARSLHQHALLLPRQLLSVLRKADSGDLKFRLEPEDLEKTMHRLDTMFNRLAFSIVVAAMIVAPALWMQVEVTQDRPWWHPANILLGAGVALGAWFLSSIIRSGRL